MGRRLEVHLLLHLEVDVGVTPVGEQIEGVGSVAELVHSALREESEGVQPATLLPLLPLLPEPDAVEGGGGEPGNWSVHGESLSVGCRD